MHQWSVRFLALGIGTVASCLAHAGPANGPSYKFHGIFAPTDQPATSEFAGISPDELMGREFTVVVSWPPNAANYSSDWQTGADYWGSYTSGSISVEIDVPSFDFSVPPTIASWETFNDAVLDYDQGVPQEWGDELRLISRTEWSQTLESTTTFQGHTQHEVFHWVTDYLLTMRAVDANATHFTDDSLQTNFDLTTFDTVQFEFKQIVPIAGGDPRPVAYQHWLGIVDSIIAIPEPSSFIITAIAAMFGLFSRRLLRNSPCVGEGREGVSEL